MNFNFQHREWVQFNYQMVIQVNIEHKPAWVRRHSWWSNCSHVEARLQQMPVPEWLRCLVHWAPRYNVREWGKETYRLACNALSSLPTIRDIMGLVTGIPVSKWKSFTRFQIAFLRHFSSCATLTAATKLHQVF